MATRSDAPDMALVVATLSWTRSCCTLLGREIGRATGMGLFGKVYRWREAKIKQTRRAAEQEALARGASPEEAREAGEKAVRKRRRRAMSG
jgi:hypothetical protein